MRRPVTLRDFGSYTAGGRLHRVTEGQPRDLPVTRDVTLTFDPRGTFAVEQAYVQYFIPDPLRDAPPVVPPPPFPNSREMIWHSVLRKRCSFRRTLRSP